MSVGSKIGVAFALGLVMLAAVGGSAYISTQHLLEANRSVLHTHQVQEKLDDVLSAHLDAETGQRGFLLTGKERYLDPYNAGVSRIQQDIDALASLIRDNQARDSLQQLRKLSDAKLAELRETIRLRKESGLEGTLPRVLTDRGKKVMDALRQVVAQMEAREQTLLDERTAAAEQSASRTIWTVALWMPLALVVLAVAAIFLMRTVRLGGPAAVPGTAGQTWAGIAIRYGSAVVIVAVAVVLRWRLEESFGPLPLFITFYPAVLLVASIGGGGPGIVATVLSGLAADYWFLPPLGSFYIDASNDVLALGIFSGANLGLCVLAERLRRARWAEALSVAEQERAEELARQNEELAQQSEELSRQAEELSQQAEELSQQSEELSRQNEELQTQSEEVQALNDQLGHREELLQALLEAARLAGSEQAALQEVCTAALGMFGEAGTAAIVCEKQGEQLMIRACAGLGEVGVAPDSLPAEHSFSEFVIEQNRTASLGDASLRPDLSILRVPGLEPFQAALCAPMQRAGQPFGAVTIYSDQPQEWTAEQFRLAEWLAVQCTQTLEMLRMQQEVARVASFPTLNPQPIVEADLDGRVSYTNPAAQRLFPDLEQQGADHPWLAGWPALAEACRTGEGLSRREVTVGSRFYHQTILFTPETGRIRTYGLDITERKQVEESLARDRNLLRALIDNLPDCIFVKDTQSRFLAANLATAHLMGAATPDELLGKSDADFYPPEQAAQYRADEEQLLRAGQPLLDKEEPHRDMRSGDLMDILSTKVPIADGQGKIVGLVGITRDITARKRAEAALRESEQRFRSFVEATTQVVWTTNPRGEVDMAIPAWQAYTGQSAEQAHGFGWMNAIRAEDRGRVAEAWQKAFATQGLYEVEYLLQIHDGSWRNVRARGVPVRNPDGTVREYMGVCTDITARKQAEEALQESEQRFRTMADAIPQLAWIAHADGGIFWYNQRWYEYTGTTPEQMEGWGWQSVHDPQMLPTVLERWKVCIETGVPFDMTFPLRGADGVYRPFLTRIMPMKDKRGQVMQWFGTNTDVSEQKAAEEELTAAKASAEHAKAVAELANRSKDHFLAVLSHELRTPLTPVVMGISMLQGKPDLATDVRDTLDMVRRNVEMEARLIDDLLDVMRIARGKIELNRSTVELCTVIHRAVEVCKPDIEARGLRFSVDLGPTAPYWVDVDVARLQQVFWNLLKNAIKFTPHGGGVDVRCRPENGQVVVEVNDSGIGIDAAALPRIFNAFEQAERSITRQFGGLGLGLTIGKALVEMHGGTIEAASEGRNKGATFRVRLPLTAPAGQPAAPSRAAPPQRATRPLRILLVEDHGATARMMRMLLDLEGHTVEAAGDVATALELAGQQDFDLLLSDLGLPDGSGHDLMRQLRERGYQFPGIALSGYGREDDIQRSQEAGFAAHLTKPASREAVVKAVDSIAGGQPIASTGESATTPPPDAAVFDARTALDRCLGKQDLLARMIGFFLDDVDVLLPQIQAALRRGELAEMGRLAHRLKGTIAHLAAEPAREAALRVERVGEEGGEPAAVEEAVQMLERECGLLKAALAAHACQAEPKQGD